MSIIIGIDHGYYAIKTATARSRLGLPVTENTNPTPAKDS